MNKKGFTLAELMLVILLVGVLSLLASTAVLGHIHKTKRDAALRNAIAYVSAINDYNFIDQGEDPITTGTTSTITPKLKDSLDGTKPTSGTVTISTATNKVSNASLVYNNYTVTFNGSSYTITDN